MLARDRVNRGVDPFVGAKFGKAKFLDRSSQANRNACAFKFGIILDAGAQFAQAGQDLLASIPDAGDKTEAGNDDASRRWESLRGHLRGKSSEAGPFCI